MKIIKNGFGKKTLNIFKLNDTLVCINLFGIAIFIGKVRKEA